MKIVKIGGNVVDNPDALLSFLKDFSQLAGPKILVHGGGKEATRLGEALGIHADMIDGRRVTDRATLDVVTMVYAGLINKRIVALLQSLGVDAIGLSGADAGIIKATRRCPEPIDYGFVGDIDPLDVNDRMLASLTDRGLTPVICAIMHDGAGTLLNCNADSVASALAVAAARIAPTDLVFCFEKCGVLHDPEDDSSVIGEITAATFAQLKAAGIVSKGMLPKIENALQAVAQGVRSVTIKHSDNLLNDTGTVIRNA